MLNYVRVPRQRTAPDRANKASASARRPTLGPPTNDADQYDVTSPPTSESLINVNKLVVTNSPLHQAKQIEEKEQEGSSYALISKDKEIIVAPEKLQVKERVHA